MDKRIKPAIAVAVLTAAAIPAGVRAQAATPSAPASENDVTVYAGYRFGGGFTDVATGKTWEITEGPAFSLAADFGIDPRTQWEIFISHRNASLKTSGLSAGSVDRFGLGITYYHFGGTYFFEEVGKGGYVVGGLGLTNFTPGDNLSSETRFSLNIGGGYMIPLSKHVGLKFEGRGYVTLIDSTGGFFCSGGCVVQIKGTTFTQAEAMAGIVARF